MNLDNPSIREDQPITYGQQNGAETFRIRRGLMTRPILFYTVLHLIIGWNLYLNIKGLKGSNEFLQRWEFWALVLDLLLVLPIGWFILQRRHTQRSIIEFTGRSLVQARDRKRIELPLNTEAKLGIYLHWYHGFILRAHDTDEVFVRSTQKGILLGASADFDVPQMDRLLRAIRPFLQVTPALRSLFLSSRGNGKALPVQAEWTQDLFGEIRFQGLDVHNPIDWRRVPKYCLFGVLLHSGVILLLTRDFERLFSALFTTPSMIIAFYVWATFIFEKQKHQILIGTNGLAKLTQDSVHRATSFRHLGDLTYTVAQVGDKTLATISGKPGPETFKAVVVIESDEHLAQLEQAIQDAQSKLGTPLAKEKRQ